MLNILNIINYLIVVQILFSFLKQVKGGQLYVQDYELDYTNQNDVTQMKFIFSLESGLGKNNYLRLSFPEKIYISPTIAMVEVKYSYQGTNGCSQMQHLPAQIQLDGASTKDYLIKFMDDILQPAELLPYPNWYALYIKPEKGVLFSQGIEKPIVARTQSIDTIAAIYGKPIIYDFTNSFATLEFDSNPYTTLDASVSIPTLYTTIQYVIGMKYQVSFIVKPQASILNGARIVILINKNPSFLFTGQCVSEEHSDLSGTIPPMDSSEYTCSVDKESNRIVILINAGVTSLGTYRFRGAIQNPNSVSGVLGDIEVRTMLNSSNKIIEKKIITGVLKTNPLSATQAVIMGNGINLSDVTYRKKASIISGYNFYNPFQFQFTPNSQTPDKIKLRVQFKIKIDMANDVILTGSIQHNFPRYDIKVPVKCVLLTIPGINYYIQCDEIGPLSNASVYYTTARVYFKNPGTLDSYFGSVNVQTIDEVTGIPNILIPEVVQVFADKTIVANLDVVDTSVSNYGHQMIHSQISEDSSGQLLLSPILSTNAGIKVCENTAQKQKLVITMNKGINGYFGGGTDLALRLTTTPFIKAVQGDVGSLFYVESLNPSCTISTAFPTDDRRNIVTSDFSTDILLVQTGGSPNCMSQSGSTTTFSIGNVQILSQGSSYAGRDAFDFYGALYSNYVDSTSAPNKYFAVNANTISMAGSGCTNTQLNYINISLSNYQTSSGGQSQIADGVKYTAFIRITGYLTETEKLYAKRIAVFFNNVDFYPSSDDDYGQKKVSCSSSMNSNQQCWGYNGNINESSSIHSMKRVEFDVSAFIAQTGSSSPFQLLIPVKALPSWNTQRIFIAVLTNNPYYGQLTQAYIPSNTMSQYTIITGSIAAFHSVPSDLNYNLVVSTRVQGQSQDADLKIGHQNAVQNCLQNIPSVDPSKLGAAFVIVGNWKMYSDTLSISSNSIVNTNVMSERCLPFYYDLAPGNTRYGIFCPFTQKDSITTITATAIVTFNNFIFPAKGPLKLSGTYISWSQNTGALISVIEDSYLPTETIASNKISNVASIQLKRYYKDNRVEWKFTTSNPFPANGIIDIKLDESGNAWGFQVMVGNLARCILFQQTGSFKETACTVSVTGISIQFTFAAAKDFPAGNYKLVQYGIKSPSSSLSKVYTITISTLTSGLGAIDTSDSSSTFTFDNNVIYNTSVDQISFAYSHNLIEGSIGNLDLSFRIAKRPILALSTPNPGAGLIPGQYLEIYIQKLIGQEGRIDCQVLQDNKIYFGFMSINAADANKIQLFPREDILTENAIFNLRCTNVVNSFQDPTIYQVRLLYNDGAVQEVLKGSLTPTAVAFTTPTPITSALLSKFNDLAGSLYHLQFKITLVSHGISKQSSIFLKFPIKYDHSIGNLVTHCQVNSKVVYCVNYFERCLQISGFPLDISAGSEFLVEVYGITVPLSTAAPGQIQVSIASTRDPSSIVEQVEINDSATIADTTNSFIITSSDQSNIYSREKSTFSFNLLYTSPILVNQFLYLEFPNEFGTSITVSPPQDVQIISLDGSQIFGQNCVVFGGNIMIKVSTEIPVGEFKLNLSSVINPEDTLCKIKKIMISILSDDRTAVLGKSTISSSNQVQYRSSYSSNFQYMNWYSGNKKILYNSEIIVIKAGTYSELLTLKDETGPFSRMINYEIIPLPNADFQLLSDKKIYPGQNEENLRIGCPISTIPGMFTLMFSKTESNTSIQYGNISLMNVIIMNNQHIISPEYTTYQVYAGGFSLPIKFDLSNMLPYEDISILFEVIPGATDPKIDLVNENNQFVPQYTLNFSPSQPQGKIFVRSAIYMTATPAHQATLKMTIFGTDINSYIATTDPIIFQLISDTPIPDFQYTQVIDQVSPSATKQNLRVTSNMPCQIFYHIRLQKGPSRPLQEVQQLVDQYVRLNPVDYYQEQFGSFNYETQNKEQSYSILNLRSKLNYIISTWAVDSLKRISNRIDFSFTTKNNNGRVMKIPIEFQKDITALQKQTITCYLCQLFAIPCLNVMSFDVIYCQQQSEYQLKITDSVNINQQRVLNQIENIQKDDEIYKDKSRILTTATQTSIVNFYTISIDQYEQDISWNNIIKIVGSSSFASNLASNDLTLPVIQSIGDPTEINQQTPPVFVNLPNVQSGKTWLYIDNLETHINSLIWMYLVDLSNGGTPTQQQMKFKLTSKNKTTDTFNIKLFQQSSLISHNFTGLIPETQYALYILGTTENPSLFAPSSEVSFIGYRTANQTVQVKTQASHLSVFISVIIIFIILM